MKRLEFTTKDASRRMQRIIDKAMGFPAPGVNIGGGLHADPPLGTDQWTTIKRCKSHSLWVLICDGPIQQVVKDATCMARLNALQRTDLTACVDAAKDVEEELEEDDT